MVSSTVSSRSREKVLGGLRIGRILFTAIGGNSGYLQKDLSDEKVRTLLRSRTLTVLDSLGPDGPHLEQGPRHKRIEHALRHKRTVMTFLSEASLIDKDNPVVDLKEANLNHADLNYMNLKNANLPFVFLKGSALDHVILENADLGGAHLENAYLGDANLSDANLNAAYLNGANLSDAWGWTEEQLRAAQSLKGATMPDGQTLGDATTNGPTFEE